MTRIRRYLTMTCLVALTATTIRADVPALLNFQGRLQDGTNPVSGAVSLALRIYTNDTSGDFLYEDSNTVAVLDGLYATLIGDNTTAGDLVGALEIAGSSAWLGVIVNGTELLPRARMASTAFALLTGPKGAGNKELGLFATVDGGATNIASGDSSTIGGGQFNSITNGSSFSVIGGGWKNLIGSFSLYSVIAGGLQNTIAAGTFYSSIGGGFENDVGADSYYSTIAGGNGNDIDTLSWYASIGGGWDNDIAEDADYATIAGGSGNDIFDLAMYSAIGGGCANDILEGSLFSTIAGGRGNDIGSNAHYAVIGGGATNKIGVNAHYSAIPGGKDNEVNADYGLAAGYRAKVNDRGSFVWADATAADFGTTSSNQFLVRASGGVGIGTNDPGSAALRVAGLVESTAGGFKFPDGSVQIVSAGVIEAIVTPWAFSGNHIYSTNTGGVGIGTNDPGSSALRVMGLIESTAGGIKFPDGTVQVSAEEIQDSPSPWAFSGNHIYSTNSGDVGLGTAATSERLTVAGNIAPSANIAFTLGTPTRAWRDLYLDSLIDHRDTLRFVNDGDILMLLETDGSLTVSGSVDAVSYSGDGSALTGVAPGDDTVDSATISNGSVTASDVDASTFTGTFWKLDGNAGTSGGTDYLGTPDFRQLEFRIDNKPVFRFEPDTLSPRITGGYASNFVGVTSSGSAVLSGGAYTMRNEIGESNSFSVIVGGVNNEIEDAASYSVVAGGELNTISNGAKWASIAGGWGNSAAGDYSFAAGRQAAAADNGCFVWADSSPHDFVSEGGNQFRVRAVGGAAFITGIDGSGAITSGIDIAPGASAWSALSDRASKENIQPINGRIVLEKLDEIEIARWNWKTQDDSIEHMGPMAQDFHAAFGLGESDRRISTVDADGVALAAVQSLYRIVQEKDAQIAALSERLERLEAALAPPASSD